MSDNSIAFGFPGQGSQKVGMLAAAHERFAAVRDAFTEASDALGYDMWHLVQNGEQEALKAAGAKRAMPLPVSAPFHTALMKPAGKRLADAIAAVPIRTPDIPVVHTVRARSETDPERMRGLLVEQIYSPVQWTACVETMAGQGYSSIVECGPGKVLSGLNRRIDKSLQSFSPEEPDALDTTLQSLGAQNDDTQENSR
jgi:malonyl CoA-acyl carrier protein transacylase